MLKQLSFRWVIVPLVVFGAPAWTLGGANSWTSIGPGGGSVLSSGLMASPAAAPDTVYAVKVSSPDEALLHRSNDGGRSWAMVATFQEITSICADPASASTVYVGGRRSDALGIFKSTDGGVSWRQSSTPGGGSAAFTQIAVSTKPSGPLYAATQYALYKSVNGGVDWTTIKNPPGQLTQAIAFLLIDPSEESTTYVGGMEDAGYYYGGAFFRKSSDDGAHWSDLTRGQGFPYTGKVTAVAIEPSNSATIFVGLEGRSETAVFRSDDGGAHWDPAAAGLPEGVSVSSLAMDPGDSRTLYAGTDRGVFRTRNSGTTWVAFGQQLNGFAVDSLRLDGGRLLRAGSRWGLYELEIGAGGVDVAAGAGRSHVLSWDAGRLSVQTRGDSGESSSTPPEGPFGGWLATAIAAGPDGLSRVLWVNGDGAAGLEILGATGSQAVHRFPAKAAWSPVDVSVGTDGIAHILWRNLTGVMSLSSVDSSGNVTLGPHYGPYPTWTPLTLADAPDGSTRVLWRKTDGRFSISVHHGLVMGEILRFPAIAERAAEDITVASDGNARVLLVGVDDGAVVATVDASGALTNVRSHSPGLRPRRIAAGPDGLTRLLFSDDDGIARVLLLSPDNSITEPNGPLSGEWIGTFDSIDGLDCPLGTPANARFTQDGTTVDGVLHMTPEGCGCEEVTFVGTLLGGQITGTLGTGGNRYHFNAGSTAEGTLSAAELTLALINKSPFPYPIPGGTMHLHRLVP